MIQSNGRVSPPRQTKECRGWAAGMEQQRRGGGHTCDVTRATETVRYVNRLLADRRFCPRHKPASYTLLLHIFILRFATSTSTQPTTIIGRDNSLIPSAVYLSRHPWLIHRSGRSLEIQRRAPKRRCHRHQVGQHWCAHTSGPHQPQLTQRRTCCDVLRPTSVQGA